MELIDKAAVVAEIERIKEDAGIGLNAYEMGEENGKLEVCDKLLSFIDSIEVKEVKEPSSTSYVVTRSEEHSDYVEEVFFDEKKAQEYCDQFNGNEDEYVRHITKVEVKL